MPILSTPPSLNISNPLSGIADSAKSLTNINSFLPNSGDPTKTVSGLEYKKPLVDCLKFQLSSLDILPCPKLPNMPSLKLPSKQELVNRAIQFIPKVPDLSIPNIPGLPGVPNLSSVNLNNIVKNELEKATGLEWGKCPAVPTAGALKNIIPDLKAQVKLWLNEPITLPKLKDLLPNLPKIPKPPYFSLPCSLPKKPTTNV